MPRTKRTAAPTAMNGTPAAIGPLRTLEKIAAYYEHRAAVVRETMRVLADHSGASAHRRMDTTLADAMAIDSARRRHRKIPPAATKSRQRSYHQKETVAARRAVTAKMLAGISDSEYVPKPKGFIGIGPLIAHGYLKTKGALVKRTAKPFTVDRGTRPDAAEA